MPALLSGTPILSDRVNPIEDRGEVGRFVEQRFERFDRVFF